MNNARHKRNFSYQPLEARQMLAGDVSVFEGGHLYVRGDAADNQFEVVSVGDQLRINGLQGTTINGKDSYLITRTTVTDTGVAFEGGLRAHLGPGSDDLMVQDAVFESSSIIYGGTGDDNIEVVDAEFMDKVVVQTFDGDDSISTMRSHFEGPLYIQTLDGQDSVSMTDSVFAGDSFVVTGNNADTIDSDGNHYTGDLNLFLPLGGDDTVRLANPVVGEQQLGIFLGNGDDTIHGDLSEAEIAGTIRIAGQGGTDRALEMSINAETESQVSMASIEATGDLVYQNVNNRTDVYGVDSFSKDAENNYRNFPATQIEFAENTDIYSVSWAGSYDASTPNNNDRYVVTVYGNRVDENIWEGEFDLPDQEEILFEAVLSIDDLTRVATGETWSERGGPQREIFEFAADVEIQLEGGQKYWISIYQDLQVDQSDTAFAEYDNPFMWLSGTSDTLRKSAYHWSGNGFLSSGEASDGQIFELRS